MDNEICKQAAKIYAGEDFHKLSLEEEVFVKMLEEMCYIIPNDPVNGFVGKAS